MAETHNPPPSIDLIRLVPRRVALGTLRLFQLCISPLYSPCCRFFPSCSQYAVEAITKFGLIRGAWLTLSRLARCHPLAHGGVDLVPEEFEPFPWRNRENPNENHKHCDHS